MGGEVGRRSAELSAQDLEMLAAEYDERAREGAEREERAQFDLDVPLSMWMVPCKVSA